MIRALLLEQIDDSLQASVQSIPSQQLPSGNVLVDVDWSGINYKDALAISGKGKIIRQFPMVPGIDFSGIVKQSSDPRYHVGQAVVLTGWGVGENHWGGLAQQARVNGDWLIPLPHGLDQRKAMIIGTAGFTAMLCVMALEEGGVTPDKGRIIVTGASGGVGSISVKLLAELGYRVVAVTGRQENQSYLKMIGAQEVLSRSDFITTSRPLDKQLWAGAIDTAGGSILANLLSHMDYGATVAACGLAHDYQLPTTVMPFILRNVRLQGVDSVMTPYQKRVIAWQRLSQILPDEFYQQVVHEIRLDDVINTAHDLLNNRITGRTLVKVS